MACVHCGGLLRIDAAYRPEAVLTCFNCGRTVFPTPPLPKGDGPEVKEPRVFHKIVSKIRGT